MKDESQRERLGTVLHVAAQCVLDCNTILAPFLPFSANAVWTTYGGEGELMPMPRIDYVEDLDPDDGAGLHVYPVITGDYSATPRWASRPGHGRRDGRQADADLHQARPERGRRGARPPRGLITHSARTGTEKTPSRRKGTENTPSRPGRLGDRPDAGQQRERVDDDREHQERDRPAVVAGVPQRQGRQPEDQHLDDLAPAAAAVPAPSARRTATTRSSRPAGAGRRAASAAYRPASPTPRTPPSRPARRRTPA